MIAKELELTFNRSLEVARARRHDMVTLEHLLYAILDDDYGAEILRACGADLDELRKQLDEYLDTLDQVPDGRAFELEQTLGVTRMLRRAAIHVQSSGKKEIDAGDVLAAMYREPESQAVYLLSQQGVSRLDILEFISHGVSSVGEEPAHLVGGEEDE